MKPPFKDRIILKIKTTLGMKVYVCDNCKWNWRSACHVPERPHVSWCPDYEKRGR
jgi:hypothetical protein